jgi:hypothetical protein
MIRFTFNEYPARGHAMGHGGSVDCSEHGACVRVLRHSDDYLISTERGRFIDSLLAKYKVHARNDREIPAPAQACEEAA